MLYACSRNRKDIAKILLEVIVIYVTLNVYSFGVLRFLSFFGTYLTIFNTLMDFKLLTNLTLDKKTREFSLESKHLRVTQLWVQKLLIATFD